MEEPSMLIQRPSSSHSQETSHILFTTFRDLFNQDGINEDLIDNLSTSKSGDNVYHDTYVEKLQLIHKRWSSKISAIDDMINHLDKAKQQARQLEKDEEEKAEEAYAFYKDLGLPSVPSRLDQFLDNDALRENNLVVPNEFLDYKTESFINPGMSGSSIPQYASSTFSSRKLFDKIPSLDDYLPEPEPILPRNSKVNQPVTKKLLTRLSQTNSNKNEKNVWRHCITPKQREEEKKEIMKLQKRADFLKNPRFTTNTRSLVKTSNKEIENILTWDHYFEPYPFPVIFNDYNVGETYQIKLELKNITAASRQLRILEPKSSYFSVGSGEFPSEKGLIAPGMSCTYTITFSPQTLEDYDDVLQVKTQEMESLLIPLQGRRKAPNLTLHDVIDCGYSLVGSRQTKEFVVQNLGGDGRFYLTTKHTDEKHPSKISWDELDYDADESIECGVFTVSPKCFSLQENESVVFKVTFAPSAVKSFTSSIVMFCDNCGKQDYDVTGHGEIAEVELVSVEGGLSQPYLGETQDVSATDIVRFQDTYPGVVYSKELKIKNKVSIPVSYEWDIQFPNTSPDVGGLGDSDDTNIFQIHPASGILDEQSTTSFHIQFSPDNIGNWYNVICMNLKNIPTLEGEEFIERDVQSVKLSLKGDSQPFSVVANPSAIIMSGQRYYGIPYYRTIKLINESSNRTTFQWTEYETESLKVSFDPIFGEIDANGSVEFLVTILGKKANKEHVQIPFDVPYTLKKSSLYIQTNFIGPNVCFEENDVTFGLVKLGDCVQRTVTLYNKSPTKVHWDAFCQKNEYPPGTVSISPTDGILEGNEKQDISLTFYPNTTMTYNGYLTCHIEDSKPCHLPLFGEVQRPHVYLQSSQIMVDTAFINIPLTTKITLCNSRWLPAKCHFVQNEDDAEFDIEPKIKSFELKAHENADIDIAVVFHEMGEIEGLVAVQVEDMLEPVVFSLSANVKGLMVDVSVPNLEDIENESELVRRNDIIDFGQNVLLGQFKDALLVIENKSAIKTNFDLSFREFQNARLPTPPEGSANLHSKRSSLKSILSRSMVTHRNKTDSQIQRELSEAALRGGKGLALICTPSHGYLEPFERKIVTVTCQSDMWGDYNDVLHCKIGDEVDYFIPVHVDIIGSPLNFQMAKDQPPIVRFGTHSAGANSVQRSLRINNTSFVDLRLDWQTYIIDPNDDQLIDFNCYYGNPFPQLNEDGSEVVEEPLREDGNDNNLIKVVLNEHQGKPSDIPFKVVNKQLIIPAQSHASLELCFTPPSSMTIENNYVGYAIAYMSLHVKDKRSNDGSFVRADGLEMLPFGLNMTACVVPPKVLVETCDEDEFRFELNASDLMDSSDMSLQKQISCTRRFLFTNRTGTSVSFSCTVQPPFQMKVTNDKLTSSKMKNNADKYTLKSNQNLEVFISFLMTPDLVKKNKEHNETMVLQEAISIQYNDGKSQSYPLTGIINYPNLLVHKEIIDFDVCFVGEKLEKIFRITNSSKSTLYWKVEIDKSCPQSVRDVFSINETSGTIVNMTSKQISKEIIVTFIAKHNVEYECILYISSTFHQKYLNGTKKTIRIRGVGSYDEATKAVY